MSQASPGARRAARAGLVVALLWALLLPAALSAEAATTTATPPPNGSMCLTYQSPWVGASGDLSLRLRVERPPGRAEPEVAVTV